MNNDLNSNLNEKRLDNAAKKFRRLVEIMDTLRGENGCPWDLQQNHQSLMPYLIEEAYEVIETIEEKEYKKLSEELGDLLLQIIFHARVAKDEDEFDITDVIDSINSKLIRRHPHIFGDVKAENAEQVLKNWEEIKLKEKGGAPRKSLMTGVPPGMPSLLYARRLQERAAGVGFDWPEVDGVFDKMAEEIEELKEAVHTKDHDKVTGEFGDLLFGLVNVARWMGVNPEEALRKTSKKFIQRFSHIEDEAKKRGVDLSEMSLNEMEESWQASKKFEKNDLS